MRVSKLFLLIILITLSSCVLSTKPSSMTPTESEPVTTTAVLLPTPSPKKTTVTVTPSPTSTPSTRIFYVEEREKLPIIADMQFDDEGFLWLAGLDGIVKWHPETGIAARYTISDGLTSDFVSHITIDMNGRIWASPYVGYVLSFDGKQWLPEHSVGYITSLIVAPDGTLWVSAYEAVGAYSYDGTRWVDYKTMTDKEGNKGFVMGVTSLAVSAGGEVWASANCCMSPTALYSLLTPSSVSQEGRPTYWGRMITGTDGALWTIGRWVEYDKWGETLSDQSGIARYDPVNDIWNSYMIPLELSLANPETKFYELAMVSPSHLWFCDSDGRVVEFAEGKWQVISPEGGFGSNVTTMLIAPDGKLWVGTSKGSVAQYDETGWQIYDLGKFFALSN